MSYNEINPKIKKRIRSIVFCALRECVKKKYIINLTGRSIEVEYPDIINSDSITIHNKKYMYYNDVCSYNPIEFRLKGKNFKCYYSDLGKLYGISEDDAANLIEGFVYGDWDNPFQSFGRSLNFECRGFLKKISYSRKIREGF